MSGDNDAIPSGEVERSIAQQTDIEDTLSEVETHLNDLNTEFVRIQITPVTADKHAANEKFAELVDATDECLNCGERVDEGGFCDYSCFMEWGSDGE